MRKFISTFVLLFVLCCPAFAGEMLTPPAAPPSPVISAAPAPEDEIAAPPPADVSTTPGVSVAQMALSVLESLLSII
jgi:hypothetical protein